MTDEGLELFIRWMLRSEAHSDRVRSLYTAAVIVADDEGLLSFSEVRPVTALDERLLEELLALAEPAEAVGLLDRVAHLISAELFQQFIERVTSRCNDIGVISRLMFLAGMFLDRHPGAFQLSKQLSEQLWASDDFDERLGAIKSFPHTGASDEEILARFTSILRQNDFLDHPCALSLLSRFLQRRGPQIARWPVGEVTAQLQAVLAEIKSNDQDADARRLAAQCARWLDAGEA